MRKIKINNYVFECFSTQYFNGYTAVLKADNVEDIKQAFVSVSSIVECNEIGQVINTITDCTKLKSIREICDYYIGADNASHSAYEIILDAIDLNEKMSLLEKQINPVVNGAAMNLEEYQNYRILQSKDALQLYLEENPIIAVIHGGKEGTYSINQEKQNQMLQRYMMYKLQKEKTPDTAVLTWNESGEVCEVWTEEEYETLLGMVCEIVYTLVAYQQTVEKQIKSEADKAVISQMVFDYASADPRNANEKMVTQ